MRHEQWIFYKDFPVFGHIENLRMDNIFSEDIYIKFRENKAVEIL